MKVEVNRKEDLIENSCCEDLHSADLPTQSDTTCPYIAGLSDSWWMLNPEGGKSGKSPRRRAASMDNNSKFAKSRGRAAKKKVGADSPGSQYGNNDDFDAWTACRPRTSSNASTLSGRLSPFIDDELGDSDVHMVYPGPGSGAKMTSTLPSFGSENVMENLLDNLNLLSPKNPSVGIQPASPGYSPYSSPGMAAVNQQTQQDYRNMSPMPMQPLQDSKPSFVSSPGTMGQFNCTAGLLKELLTSDGEPGDLMPSVDTVVSHISQSCPLSSAQYAWTSHISGIEWAIVAPSDRDWSHVKSAMQMQYGGSSHLGGGLPPYCSVNSNGYGRNPGMMPHQQQQHLEKLPSDLDGMPVERFECDVESILHDTLMDGESLDFNFDPMATQQG
ncbi:hypothetical protein M9458_029878, partial [Cirrhinus mrigala]